ncbi:hypothetical protein [Microcoleus asticus]|nr:hypothetical protein [Microcoleus asticus]
MSSIVCKMSLPFPSGADTAMPFPYGYWGLRHYSGGGHGNAVSLL